MPAARQATSIVRSTRLGWLALASLALAACTHGGVQPSGPAWGDARQMVLVTTAEWDANRGTMRSFVRDGDGWGAASAAVPVTVGRSGSAWGLGLHAPQAGPQKREGDGRAPAGVFRIGTAFGYAGAARTALPYAAMDAGDWCIDVPASPLYNRIVDAATVGQAAVAGSTEPMRRDLHANGDQRYKLGFVVEHNAQARSGAGSCIFAHLWKAPGEATAGCTAMDEVVMRELLAWLDVRQHPVFVLLPEGEYARLRTDWGLPGVAP
jgi:L,D-peptidoglycan transpeptidase YkuD (ErfK/YbiS/YcfS/YnhG family)